MRRLASRALGSLGSQLCDDDLVHAFLIERGPRLVQLMAEIEPEAKKKYLFTAFKNFVRSALRQEKRHAASVEQLAYTAIVCENADPALAPFTEQALSGAVSALSRDVARAAGLFLGVHGSSSSIRQISELFGISRYTARLYVLDGVLGAAIHLGHFGALTDRQVEACRYVIIEGKTPSIAAGSLGITVTQVQSALSTARQLIAAIIPNK